MESAWTLTAPRTPPHTHTHPPHPSIHTTATNDAASQVYMAYFRLSPTASGAGDGTAWNRQAGLLHARELLPFSLNHGQIHIS